MIIFLRVCVYPDFPKLLLKVQCTVENIKITSIISIPYPLPFLPKKGINTKYWQLMVNPRIQQLCWEGMTLEGNVLLLHLHIKWLHSRPWEVFRSACNLFKPLLFICHNST